MLNAEAQRRLAQLLCQFSDTELAVEGSRQQLCHYGDFGVTAAFSLIDREGFDLLNIASLLAFLESQGVSRSVTEVRLLVMQYDGDGDECLSFSDFAHLVLPFEHETLRGFAEDRDVSLSSTTQQMLARHLDLEIEAQSYLNALKLELSQTEHFSPFKAFYQLNPGRTSAITLGQLKEFLDEQGRILFEPELHRILRRIDTDGDEMLNFAEFSEACTPRLGSSQSTVRSASFSQTVSASCSHPRSPSEATTLIRKSSTTTKKKKAAKKKTTEPKTISQFFRAQLSLVRQLHSICLELEACADYCSDDFFSLADLGDNEVITYADLQSLLADLAVSFTQDDLYLIVKQFSSSQDGTLTRSDFKQIWGQMNSMKSPQPMPLDRMTAFSQPTQETMSQAWTVLIEVQRKLEQLRHQAKATLSIPEAFKAVDKDQDGLLSLSDLQTTLLEARAKPSVGDLERLHSLYDRNFDGKVTYSEFVLELTPRLPAYTFS